MKAIQIAATGGPDVLNLVELADPVPGDGQVVVRANAIGVGKPDVLFRTGMYRWMPPLPAVPGAEMAGTVLAPFGLIVSFNALGGPPAKDLFKEMRANLSLSPAVRCFTMQSFDHDPEAKARIAARVVNAVRRGHGQAAGARPSAFGGGAPRPRDARRAAGAGQGYPRAAPAKHVAAFSAHRVGRIRYSCRNASMGSRRAARRAGK